MVVAVVAVVRWWWLAFSVLICRGWWQSSNLRCGVLVLRLMGGGVICVCGGGDGVGEQGGCGCSMVEWSYL